MGTNPLPLPHTLLFGKTRWAILSLLFNHPEKTFYLRQLVREAATGPGAVQRELKALSEAGLLVRSLLGGQVHFHANPACPIYGELRGIVLKAGAGERRASRSGWPVAKGTLAAEGGSGELVPTTPAERLGMVWELTRDSWAFAGSGDAEPRLSRHLVRSERRGG